MEWTQAIREAVAYIEAHLLEDITPEDVAAAVHVSSFYFQKGFSLMSGYTIGEYIRDRRLYLAALDLIAGEEKVIDLALKYGYESPESFTKAFRRFHGMSPAAARQARRGIRPFLPLKITVSVKGGNEMDYTIENMDAFRIIGVHRRFRFDSSYREIPAFWDAFRANDMGRVCASLGGACSVGKYGVCIDDGTDDFEYWIASDDPGTPLPEELSTREIPAQTWAKFTCTGPLPGALQSVNTQIFNEWLPGNPEWEIAAGYNIELYDMGDTGAADYHSEIWIPVKRRAKA